MNLSLSPQDYSHITDDKVRYDDLDTYQHVNNKAFLTYIEDSRVRYLQEAGAFTDGDTDQEGIVIARGEIDYLASILYGDKVKILTRCVHIGTKSYELHSLVIAERKKESILSATAKAIIVTINRNDGTSRINNPKTIQAIQHFEKHSL